MGDMVGLVAGDAVVGGSVTGGVDSGDCTVVVPEICNCTGAEVDGADGSCVSIGRQISSVTSAPASMPINKNSQFSRFTVGTPRR